MPKLSELATRITIFKESTGDSLDLSRLELNFFPDWFLKGDFFDRVRDLDLSHNDFKELPLQILQTRFRRLQRLNLTGNPLKIDEKVIETCDPAKIYQAYLQTSGVDLDKNKAELSHLNTLENEQAGLAGEQNGFLAKLFNSLYYLITRIPFISKSADGEVEGHRVSVSKMPLKDRAKIWESVYGPFPRPINYQHLSSYAALRGILKELSLTFFIILNCLASFIVWFAIGYFLNNLLSLGIGDKWIEKFDRLQMLITVVWMVVGFFPVFMITLFDGAWNLWKPYYGFEQRETTGVAKWLMPKDLHYSQGWLYCHDFLKEIDVTFKTFVVKYFLWIMMKTQIGKIPTSPLKHNMFPIAPFGYRSWLCLPLPEIARHALIFGVPGSGKSASFAMSYTRSAGEIASAVVLDVKGELYKHCAHKFKHKFRFDFIESAFSDRFLLGRMCRNDFQFAQTLAQSIVGVKPGEKSSAGNEEYFQTGGANLLTALLLHMAEVNEDFTPAEIFTFLEDHALDDKQGTGFVETLKRSPNQHTRQIISGMPVDADVTMGGILSNMTNPLYNFMNPHVIKILTPPNEEELKAGCRVFDPMYLRVKSTGLFIVVSQKDSQQLGNVTGSIINIVSEALKRATDPKEADVFLNSHAARMMPNKFNEKIHRQMKDQKFAEFRANHFYDVQQEFYKTGAAKTNGVYVVPEDKIESLLKIRFAEKLKEDQEFYADVANRIRETYLEENNLKDTLKQLATVFFIIDEAGNVKLTQVREDTGVGRGLMISFILFYHNIDQMEVQFGDKAANNILGTCVLKIFLPGLEGKTAKYASFLLRRTTTFLQSGVDSNVDAFDSSRLQETGRDLRTEDEIRTLAEKHQAIAVFSSLDPMLIAFPPHQKETDTTITYPPKFGHLTVPATLEKYRRQGDKELGMAQAWAIASTDLKDQVETINQAAAEKFAQEGYEVKKHIYSPQTLIEPEIKPEPPQESPLLALNSLQQNAEAELASATGSTDLGMNEKKSDNPNLALYNFYRNTPKTKKLDKGDVNQPELFRPDDKENEAVKSEFEQTESEDNVLSEVVIDGITIEEISDEKKNSEKLSEVTGTPEIETPVLPNGKNSPSVSEELSKIGTDAGKMISENIGGNTVSAGLNTSETAASENDGTKKNKRVILNKRLPRLGK